MFDELWRFDKGLRILSMGREERHICDNESDTIHVPFNIRGNESVRMSEYGIEGSNIGYSMAEQHSSILGLELEEDDNITDMKNVLYKDHGLNDINNRMGQRSPFSFFLPRAWADHASRQDSRDIDTFGKTSIELNIDPALKAKSILGKCCVKLPLLDSDSFTDFCDDNGAKYNQEYERTPCDGRSMFGTPRIDSSAKEEITQVLYRGGITSNRVSSDVPLAIDPYLNSVEFEQLHVKESYGNDKKNLWKSYRDDDGKEANPVWGCSFSLSTCIPDSGLRLGTDSSSGYLDSVKPERSESIDFETSKTISRDELSDDVMSHELFRGLSGKRMEGSSLLHDRGPCLSMELTDNELGTLHFESFEDDVLSPKFPISSDTLSNFGTGTDILLKFGNGTDTLSNFGISTDTLSKFDKSTDTSFVFGSNEELGFTDKIDMHDSLMGSGKMFGYNDFNNISDSLSLLHYNKSIGDVMDIPLLNHGGIKYDLNSPTNIITNEGNYGLKIEFGENSQYSTGSENYDPMPNHKILRKERDTILYPNFQGRSLCKLKSQNCGIRKSIYQDSQDDTDSDYMSIIDRKKDCSVMINSASFSDIWSYTKDIRQIATHQSGCRALQRRLDECSKGQNSESWSEIEFIFEQSLFHIVELMTDAFGNYLTQKLIDVCSDEQIQGIIDKIQDKFFKISTHIHGTRAIQKLVSRIASVETGRKQCIEKLERAIGPHIITMSKDLNGNHVIQKCLVNFPPSECQFVLDEIIANCIKVSTNRHGCCVVQRCVETAGPVSQARLAKKIISNVIHLASDPYGNYVVQYLLGSGPEPCQDAIASIVKTNILRLSKQKFSSNVVERCLQIVLPDKRKLLIQELIEQSNNEIEKLLSDNFGNYVLQKALQMADASQSELLIAKIKPHIHALKSTGPGRRILSKLAKKYPQLAKTQRPKKSNPVHLITL